MKFKAVEVSKLVFGFEGSAPLFEALDLDLPVGARCLLLGANGAGKSTLLRILAGKHLVAQGQVRVLGEDPFSGNLSGQDVTLVADRFPFDLDIRVSEILSRHPLTETARQLIELLEIDLEWRMHRVSNGQRRRVDLLLSLMSNPRLALLDEVTSDLDLLSRQKLLRWLKARTTRRAMTVLFATHILDGMEAWATHVAFLSPVRRHASGGLTSALRSVAPLAKLPGWALAKRRRPHAPLLWLCEKWLGEDARVGVKKK